MQRVSQRGAPPRDVSGGGQAGKAGAVPVRFVLTLVHFPLHLCTDRSVIGCNSPHTQIRTSGAAAALSYYLLETDLSIDGAREDDFGRRRRATSAIFDVRTPSLL
jgi:hypothetical protein